MTKPTNDPPKVEPVVLPDVATQPHPTAHAIPEPPGTTEATPPEANTEGTESDTSKPQAAQP
jgi:hypothetical protein